MKFDYLRYMFRTILLHIPPVHWLTVAEIMILTILILRLLFKQKQRLRIQSISAGLLAGYMYIVLASLVLIRATKAESTFQLHFLWSYIKILQGSCYNLWQNVLNIILFIPIGFLSKAIWPKSKFCYIIAFGLLYSILLETLQLVLHRGLFEFDDMLNNTIGVLIGILLSGGICRLLKTGGGLGSWRNGR